MMTRDEIDNAELRVAQIDRDFKTATTWGSWMVDLANERENLVNLLKSVGVQIEHKYQARTSGGGRVS